MSLFPAAATPLFAGHAVAAAANSIEIPTSDARTCIGFKVVPTGPAQQAIVVETVADGSSAAQAGVQRGMKLTAISDPVRRSEVWQLQVGKYAAGAGCPGGGGGASLQN